MDCWQWFFSILGLAAFLMAVQPFTQTIWGSPLLKITFSQFVNNGRKVLVFDISNEAIFNGILPKLGVYRRTAEGVRADFFVYDSSGEQLLADEFGAEIVITDKKQRQISLPAAMTDTSVDVIETLSAGASNILTTPNATPIRVGLYSLLVIVTFEGKIVKQHKLFTIGENPDGTYWVNTP